MNATILPGAAQPEGVTALLGRTPDRVLLLALPGQPLRSAWTGYRGVVQTLARVEELRETSGIWDAIVVHGVLERERWDRWFLQRLHRVLSPDGVLVVVAPDLLDVWSVGGASHIVARAMRQVRRRLAPRTEIPAADRSKFGSRRYLADPMRSMIASVGFEIVSYERAARQHVVVAKRLPSVHGSPRRPFPACATVVDWYRAKHEPAVRARDEWKQRHGPQHRPDMAPIRDWAAQPTLVLSPHPDDEVIGCGGTLMDIREAGGSIVIAQVTDGSDSAAFISETEEQRRTIRLEESARVAEALGASELICLRADNRSFTATPELRDRIREILERVRPGLVFVPSFTDIHPDHRTVLRLVADAMQEMNETRFDIALYEVWSLVAPTHVHDVSARMSRIEELLLLYETALKVDDYVHMVADRLLFHACEQRDQPGYIEAFHVIPASRFRTLAAEPFGVHA